MESLLKILVLGDSNTGKTAIVKRYTTGKFHPDTKATLGVDFALQRTHHMGMPAMMQLWDVGGQDRHGQLTRVYFRNAAAALIVTSLETDTALESVAQWKQEADTQPDIDGTEIPFILVLNKSDLREGPVDAKMIDNFCADHGLADWIETSAKTGHNIEEAFRKLCEALANSNPPKERKRGGIDSPAKGPKKECCKSS